MVGLGLGECMGMVGVGERGVGWWKCNSGDAVGGGMGMLGMGCGWWARKVTWKSW